MSGCCRDCVARGKLLALLTVSLGLVVLVAAGFAAKDWVVEEVYLCELESVEKSARATEQLAELGTSRSLPRLLAADSRACAHGAPGLAIGSRVESPFLKAARRICARHGDGVVQRIGCMMSYGDSRVRRVCASILREVGAGGVHVLRGALQDQEEHVRIESIRSLASLGRTARPTIPDLVRVLKRDRLESVRIEAARTLCSLDDARETLAAYLSECLSKDVLLALSESGELLGLIATRALAKIEERQVKANEAER